MHHFLGLLQALYKILYGCILFYHRWWGFILKRCQNHFICHLLMNLMRDIMCHIFYVLSHCVFSGNSSISLHMWCSFSGGMLIGIDFNIHRSMFKEKYLIWRPACVSEWAFVFRWSPTGSWVQEKSRLKKVILQMITKNWYNWQWVEGKIRQCFRSL